MRSRAFRAILPLAAATALALLPQTAAAVEEKTLLASDGTLYTVRAGSAGELGLTPYSASNDDNLIQWVARTQDGSKYGGIIPGATGSTVKRNLQLAYDETTGALMLLWKEEVSVLNILHLGILRSTQWQTSDLLPNLGFPHAYNPQMLLSHQTVHYTDEDGNDRTRVRPILSILWWEESNSLQARYAPIFLDEDSSANDVAVYDLVATLGGQVSNSDNGVPASAYQYPTLRADGPNGEVAASFADLASGKQLVVRITFPDDLGKSGAPDNISWLRRRIPVVGAKFHGPLPDGNSLPGKKIAVTTLIGPTYNPTLLWQAGSALNYIRSDGKAWTPVRSIPITDQLPYERALRLVEEMAGRN